MVDIERVHAVMLGRSNGRQCGKTTAMLVEAIGLSDFGVEEVLIICHSSWAARTIARQMVSLAREMGYDARELSDLLKKIMGTDIDQTVGDIYIGKTHYEFTIPLPLPNIGKIIPEHTFFDHAVDDTRREWYKIKAEEKELMPEERYRQYVLGDWLLEALPPQETR
jgi:hypothetical protein